MLEDAKKKIADDWRKMTDDMLDGLFMTRHACIIDDVMTQEEVDDFIKEVSRKHMEKYASMDSNMIHKIMASHILRSMLNELEVNE